MATICSRREIIAAASGCAALALPLKASTPRSDPEWVRALLTSLHPGLYRYQTEAQFLRRWAAFDRNWRRGPAMEQRTLTLARLLGAVRCGHTHINPYNQSKAATDALFGQRRLIPFHFRWIGRDMVVTGDPHGVGLRPGTVVAAIDGKSPGRLLDQLLPIARADGSNDDKRRSLMGLRGLDEFEEFDLYQPLLWPLGQTVQLVLRHPDGRREVRAVPTVDRAARIATRVKRPARGSADPAWTMERRGASAILTMDSWALYDSRWGWTGWLDQQFARIAADGTRGLVIDIRANEGGQDCGDVVIAHLLRQPLPAEAMRRLVRYRTVPTDLRLPLDTWDKSFLELGRDAAPAAGGYLRLPAADSGGSNMITPVAPRFDGKVAVLTSAVNSSATFQFAQRMRDAGLASLIGESTGGNRRGINGGAYFFVRLPDSGLEFDLPLIGYFPDRAQPDAGIVPDVVVPVTAAAIADGRDEAMEKALATVA